MDRYNSIDEPLDLKKKQSESTLIRELDKEYIHQVDVYFFFFTIKSAVTIIGSLQVIILLSVLYQSIRYQFLNEFLPMITWQSITTMIFILHKFRKKDTIEWRTLYYASYGLFDCFLVKVYKFLLLNSIIYDWPAQVCKQDPDNRENCHDLVADVGTISLPFIWAMDLYFLHILRRYRSMKENEEVNRHYI